MEKVEERRNGRSKLAGKVKCEAEKLTEKITAATFPRLHHRFVQLEGMKPKWKQPPFVLLDLPALYIFPPAVLLQQMSSVWDK